MFVPRIQTGLKTCLAMAAALLLVAQSNSQDSSKQLELTEDMFECLTDMQKSAIGAYFVSNILGNIKGTLAVANSESGGEFPAGSMISLIPTEVMVKHRQGWNEGTGDWEFIELNVSAAGSEVIGRGTTDVINQFGGNCFGCHQLAGPEWDLVCGTDHGCAPLPIPRATILAIQQGDPRCIAKI